MEQTKERIRVLIADDSTTVRKRWAQIINNEADMEVTAEAADGREAVRLAMGEEPDVILMDLMMPVMDGAAAIDRIMAEKPTPIIVCSSADNRKEAFKSWDSLKSGALLQIEKTQALQDPEKWEKNLIRSLRAAAKLTMKTRRPRKTPAFVPPIPPVKKRRTDVPFNVVGIGMSTGGPGIIASICSEIPADFPLPILLVIHMTSSLDASFHEWLQGYASLKVMLAQDGTRIRRAQGQILVAPPNRHMLVKEGHIRLVDTPPIHYCKPSVDVLFHSLARDPFANPVGVLLSGMGQDGAGGLKAIRDAGGYTICQDEETSVVFGMPRAAIHLDAAIEIIPSNTIAGKLVAMTKEVKTG